MSSLELRRAGLATADDGGPPGAASVVLDLLDQARPDWHERAACRGRLELMFPPYTTAQAVYDLALGMCRRCPVVAECRTEGDRLEADSTTWQHVHGVRAGETPHQRARRRRRERIGPAPAASTLMVGESA